MSHFLKMPEDPRGLLGPGMGLTIPYGEGIQRGKERGPERVISRKHPHSVPGLLQMLNSELLDMGLRRKTEERKLS